MKKNELYLGVLLGALFGIAGNLLVSFFLKLIPDNVFISFLFFLDSALGIFCLIQWIAKLSKKDN